MASQNTFAASMRAALAAQLAADKADAAGDHQAARSARLEAHRITSAAAREAEADTANEFITGEQAMEKTVDECNAYNLGWNDREAKANPNPPKASNLQRMYNLGFNDANEAEADAARKRT